MYKIFITVIGLLLSLQLYAQTINSWGFKGGITVSKYSQWSPTDTTLKKFYTKEPDARVLVNIAVFAELLSSRYFSTVGEIAYNPKGASFGYPTLDGNVSVTGEEFIDNRTGYLSLMLCEKARLRWNSMNFYVYAGPRLDLEINDNSDIDFAATYKKFNKTIFGLTTGFGAEFISKRFKILAEVQYEPDLAYTLDDTYGRVKKNTWLARIGVGIIGKK